MGVIKKPNCSKIEFGGIITLNRLPEIIEPRTFVFLQSPKEDRIPARTTDAVPYNINQAECKIIIPI